MRHAKKSPLLCKKVDAKQKTSDARDTHRATHNASGGSTVSLTPLIRFPQQMFSSLRRCLLADLSEEHFALLLARRETAPDGRQIFVAEEALIAGCDDIVSAGLCHVRPSKAFIARALTAVQNDLRLNAVIDVHTHPFAETAAFSAVDDADERQFSAWLTKTDPRISYASVLLSARCWEARVWCDGRMQNAALKTQTMLEGVPHARPDFRDAQTPEMQSRTALALGVDVIRSISTDQSIVLAGVGGLGSVIAEQLVRSGFSSIGLIDDDVLELSNLNRFSGGFRAALGRPKVEVVKEHLTNINPDCQVSAINDQVDSPAAQALMAAADWIVVSTDSHSSRKCAQDTAIKYGVPLISAGVSITVAKEGERHVIADESGEVIVIRHGDGFCLHCLGRINPYKVAQETHPDPNVRTGLVKKGYVSGGNEKEPAVMPLNTVIASLAVKSLLNQYRADAVHRPITVFECHDGFCCYPDTESMNALPDTCPACGRNVHDYMKEA